MTEVTEGHVVIALTIKKGTKAGTTLVYCSCEWSRTYGTQVGGKRGKSAHLKLNGVAA